MRCWKPLDQRMKPLRLASAVCLLASVGFAGRAVSLDLGDCEIQHGAVRQTGSTCPLAPSLTVSTLWRCQECNELKQWHEVSLTGSGQCGFFFDCNPIAIGPNFGATSIDLVMYNRRVHASGCINSGMQWSLGVCDCPDCDETPIIISVGDGALDLTSSEEGVRFDIFVDGVLNQTAWTRAGSDDAFLALDRDGDGIISSAAELFGSKTAQPVADPAQRNGFEALRVFDDSLNGGNEDGLLDESDRIFGRLRAWIDSDHDGFSDGAEIYPLAELGIVRISLDYRLTSRVDRYSNRYRFAASVETTRGIRTAWDVYLSQGSGSAVEATAARNTRSCQRSAH